MEDLPPSSSVVDDESVSAIDSAAKLADVDTASVSEPASSSTSDTGLPVSSAVRLADGPDEDPVVPGSVPPSMVEAEVDFSRLDIDAEQLVASLFGDDDSSVSFEQPPAATIDSKKGFVPADHEDAAKWFYQDPQGVIQGE